MKNMSYVATVIDNHRVEVSLCDTVPDFVHVVKYDQQSGAEVYFSADVHWTLAQENRVMELVAESFWLVPAL